MAAIADLTMEQLKKQLEKSEAGRAKLRESLGLLREKALNTGELLRQHRALKEKFDLVAEELEAEKAARDEAATDVKFAKQSVSEMAKEFKAVVEQLRSCKAQASAAQKAVNEASKRATSAASAQVAAQKDVMNIKQDVAALREQFQQMRSCQPSSKPDFKAAAATATLQTEMQKLRQNMTDLQHQLRVRQQERTSPQNADLAKHVTRLEQQLVTQRTEQEGMATEMGRWRTMFGNFAAAMGGHTAVANTPSQPMTPRVSASHPEVMLEGSVREGSNMPAGHAHVSKNACGDISATGHGSRPRAPSKATPDLGRHSTAAAPVTQQQPATVEARVSTTGQACPAAAEQLHRSAAGSATELGASATKRVAPAVAPPAAAKRLRHTKPERASDSSASDSSTDASLELDGEDGDEWEGEEGDTAADIVQMALGRLTRWTGCVPSLHTAADVAQVLVAALHSGRAPLSSIVAGFETAVLECAGHLSTPPPADDATAVASAEKSQRAASSALGDDTVSVAALKLLPVWCGWRQGLPCSFALVLHCAAMTADHLRKQQLPQELAGGRRGTLDFQEELRSHLHAATAQAGGSAGSGNPRYFPTEACAAAAAAMVLARQLGNIQAARVLVWDLLACAKHMGTRALPALGSALDVWPRCLPPVPTNDAVMKPGEASASQRLVVAMHAALQALCAIDQLPLEDHGGALSDDAYVMAAPAASLLQQLGRNLWHWPESPADKGDTSGGKIPDGIWEALQVSIDARS